MQILADLDKQTVYRCTANLEKMKQLWSDDLEISNSRLEFTDKRILLVDDDPFNCMAINALFKVLGLDNVDQRVDTAFGGQEALEKIKASIYLSPQKANLTTNVSEL